jgi:hypothetical protein
VLIFELLPAYFAQGHFGCRVQLFQIQFVTVCRCLIIIMSLSSKPKKLKPKGTVRELKLVQTINRHGADTIKAEVVKPPQQGSPQMSSTSQRNHSSSPIKRPRMEIFDSEPIPCNLEDPDMRKKRQTMVFLFLSW